MKKSLSAGVVWLLIAAGVQAGTYYVDQKLPVASDDNPGTQDKPFKTVSAAAAVAKAGDKVVVRPGVYRERVTPAHGGKKGMPVIYAAEPEHGAVICGSEVWQPQWRADSKNEGVYFTAVPDDKIFPGINPFRTRLNVAGGDKKLPLRPAEPDKLLPYSLGQIFIDDLPLSQARKIAAVEKTAGSWTVIADGREIMVHFPVGKKPGQCRVEMTVRDRLFAPARRGMGFVVVRGFIFERCANQGPFPQRGAVSTRSGGDWVIENNVIRFAQTIGLDCGSEYWNGKAIPDAAPEEQRIMIGGRHLIRNNLITDNGLCGIAGWNHRNTKVIDNVLTRNNRLSLSRDECGWEEWGAIKLHGTNALIEGNLIHDNAAYGIWIDNGYREARITRNVISNCKGAGIFLELGAGKCLIDNNIVVGTTALSDFYKGNGVYAHDASDLIVAHNLLLDNASAAVRMAKVSNRKFAGKPTEVSGEMIVNNIFSGNGLAVELPFPNSFSRNCIEDANLVLGHGWFRFSGQIGEPKWEELLQNCRSKADSPQLQDELKAMSVTRLVMPGLWRAVTGWSKTSVFLSQGSMPINFKPYEKSLGITVKEDVWKTINCRRIEGINTDFNGIPLPEHPIPGPFQQLTKGENYFLLWPVK